MAEMTTTLTGFAAATIEKKRAAEAVQEGAQAATGTAEYTFDVSHMDLFYNEFQALKDINMKIRKNEITALIGPSGCGKSTFLKTLNRMNDWVEGCRVTGDIRFEGKDIFKEVDPWPCVTVSAWSSSSRRRSRRASMKISLMVRVYRASRIRSSSTPSSKRACARLPAGMK